MVHNTYNLEFHQLFITKGDNNQHYSDDDTRVKQYSDDGWIVKCLGDDAYYYSYKGSVMKIASNGWWDSWWNNRETVRDDISWTRLMVDDGVVNC